jgi:hypothetical protein
VDLSYGAAAEAFRSELRGFLATAWQPGQRRGAELKAYTTAFRIEATARG